MKTQSLVSVLALVAQGLALPAVATPSDGSRFLRRDEEWPGVASIGGDPNNESNTSITLPSTDPPYFPTTLATSVLAASPMDTPSNQSSLIPRIMEDNHDGTIWNVVYYGSWGSADILETLPLHHISHILYAFAKIKPDGSVVLAEPASNEVNLHKIAQIKKKHRHVKVLLSIGGYTYSQEPHLQFDGARDAKFRQKFALTAVNLMQNWGFDGLDIDWEYPKGMTTEYGLLLQAVRKELDRYEATYGDGYHFPLTIATAVDPNIYIDMDWPLVDSLVDAWFIMAYDYTGPWSKKSGHHAALNAPDKDKEDTVAVNTADALRYYHEYGATKSKLMLGIPLYGRVFPQDALEFGQEFTKPSGEGTVRYNEILFDEWECSFDYAVTGAWCHDGTNLISYDNFATAQQKVEWAVENELGGSFFWQADGDRTDGLSLISAVRDTTALDLPALDMSPNKISFPMSEHADIVGNKT